MRPTSPSQPHQPELWLPLTVVVVVVWAAPPGLNGVAVMPGETVGFGPYTPVFAGGSVGVGVVPGGLVTNPEGGGVDI